MFLKCTEQYFFSNPTNMQFYVDRGVEVTLIKRLKIKTWITDITCLGVNSHLPRWTCFNPHGQCEGTRRSQFLWRRVDQTSRSDRSKQNTAGLTGSSLRYIRGHCLFVRSRTSVIPVFNYTASPGGIQFKQVSNKCCLSVPNPMMSHCFVLFFCLYSGGWQDGFLKRLSGVANLMYLCADSSSGAWGGVVDL